MSPYDETRSYSDDQTRPRLPDPPTAPQYPPIVPPFTLAASPLPPVPRRRGTAFWASVLLALGCLVVAGGLVELLITNHGSTGTTGASTHPCCVVTATPPLTTTPGVTPSTVAATCATLAEFRQAGTPDTNGRHFALAFPPQTVGVLAGSDAEAQSYQHRTLRLCLPASATDLATRLNTSLATVGWQPLPLSDPLAVNGGCQVACWSQAFAVTGGTVREAVGLGSVATQGSAETATLTLTIAPFGAGSFTLSAAAPTFNFAPGTNAPADIQFAAPGGLTLVDNALYAPVTGNQLDITYGQIRSLDYTNPGHPITLSTNSRISLKGNSGRFSKLVVTQAQQGSLTCDWVTYAYGF